MVTAVRKTVAYWRARVDLVVLLAVLAVVLGLLSFLVLSDAVRGGGTQEFDEKVLRALRDPADRSKLVGPEWVPEAQREEIARDLTALGGVIFLSLVTAAVVVYLAMDRKYKAILLVLGATLGGLGLSTLLKDFVARPRPNVVPHLSHIETASFPSGHSMLSAVVYLTLGSLLARLVAKRTLKIYFIVVALLLTFLVGFSRLCMGVHWPTDVLAGWSAGLCWAVLCWLVAWYLQRRGAVEKSTE
jgi:undecaprenyl-diphosphatase